MSAQIFTSDGEIVTVPKDDVAKMSTLKDMVADLGSAPDTAVAVPFDFATASLVLQWCASPAWVPASYEEGARVLHCADHLGFVPLCTHLANCLGAMKAANGEYELKRDEEGLQITEDGDEIWNGYTTVYRIALYATDMDVVHRACAHPCMRYVRYPASWTDAEGKVHTPKSFKLIDAIAAKHRCTNKYGVTCFGDKPHSFNDAPSFEDDRFRFWHDNGVLHRDGGRNAFECTRIRAFEERWTHGEFVNADLAGHALEVAQGSLSVAPVCWDEAMYLAEQRVKKEEDEAKAKKAQES